MKTIYAIFATYFYFLIFAQFSFLEHVKRYLPADNLNYVMAFMGGAGLLCSMLTIFLLSRFAASQLIAFSFLFCAMVSGISIFCTSLLSLSIVAAAIGVALAILTVSLASVVGDYFKRLGLSIGIGTGLAYFVCNIPQVFAANSDSQALFVTAACLLGAVLFYFQGNVSNQKSLEVYKINISPWSILLAFVALVWFDCAAFYVIQSAGELKSLTWQGGYRLWSNAFIHFIFAIIAGLLIDGQRIKIVLIFAFVFLSIGVLTLTNHGFYSAPFYCAGVSLYSTALVAFPTLTAERKNYFAGITYAIAGWFGSAMGIGMAQDLKTVPIIFIIIAGIVIFASLFAFKRQRFVQPLQMFAAMTFVILFQNLNSYAQSVEKGREVYIQEGCINCHSQFIRESTKDSEMWGPIVEREKILSEKPPLIGNRRLGPDLLNVGNRRSAEWLELHMIYPQELSPGSRMPSYAYLFKDDRGKNLVEYLKSLGANTINQRAQYIMQWSIDTSSSDSEVDAKTLYSKVCSQCHDSNGAAFSLLKVKPRDFRKEKLLYIKKDSIDDIARAIKFGIYGTSMPGHEYLSDSQILGLAKYVQALATSD